MRILVTGGKGQLGSDICRLLECMAVPFIAPLSTQLDIRDRSAVWNCIASYRPDVVMHCAAWTAVDLAEKSEQAVMEINRDGTRNIAEASAYFGSKLLYISTDYVFPGKGICYYETEDPTGPLNVYGRSKLAGEEVIRNTMEQYFIVRTSWVFGSGKNFVRTMLQLAKTQRYVKVVGDQTGSPTYTADLAPLLYNMARTDLYGTYHATNENICTWAEFAQTIFSSIKKPTAVLPISTQEYKAAAVRPINSRLSKRSLDNGGFQRLPIWQDALDRYLTTHNIDRE